MGIQDGFQSDLICLTLYKIKLSSFLTKLNRKINNKIKLYSFHYCDITVFFSPLCILAHLLSCKRGIVNVSESAIPKSFPWSKP